ncbi:MAG: hypothetical protein QM737_01635 [Ferruginibacter sp.]
MILLNRLLNKFRKPSEAGTPYKLEPPTAVEQALITELREKVAPIKEKEKNAVDFWAQRRVELIEKILKEDPRDFLRWKVIKDTMVYPGHVKELTRLTKYPGWKKIKETIAEDKIGCPDGYIYYKKSSGNLIHHAYSLHEFLSQTGKKLEDIDTIFEFGAGYGSLCRLLYKSGFKGSYIIYDLPEYLALQNYFIKSTGLSVTINFGLQDLKPNNVYLLNTIPDKLHVDFFIGLWSISEVPVELRNSIFNAISADSFLIAYQESFFKIDNSSYFAGIASARQKLSWKDYAITQLPGNRYLIGK